MSVRFAQDFPVSAEDYLEDELRSEEKHEYVSGAVYKMPGFRNDHNGISGNVLVALHTGLRGTPYHSYNSNTKVRLSLPGGLRFYYPDAQVTGHPNPPDDTFQDQPAIVVEVVSEATRRTDEVEKREAYCALPSLEVYLLVEVERPVVVGYRRSAQGFTREVYTGLDAVIPLACIGSELPLPEIYEGVSFPAAVAG